MPPAREHLLVRKQSIPDDTISHMRFRRSRDDEDLSEKFVSVSNDDGDVRNVLQLSPRFSPSGHNSFSSSPDELGDGDPGNVDAPSPTPDSTDIIHLPTDGLASIFSELSLIAPSTITTADIPTTTFDPSISTSFPSSSSSSADNFITSTTTSLVVESPSSAPSLVPESFNSNPRGMRLGIVLGCTIGGAFVFTLFAAIAFMLLRRKRPSSTSSPTSPTFFSERMVQNRPLLPYEIPKEKSINPLRRFSRLNGPSFSMLTGQTPKPLARDRREEFVQQITELQDEIEGLKRGANGEGIMGRIEAHTSMEEKVAKLKWLEAYRDSPWAAGLTDAPPPYYQLYFNS